MYALIYTKIIEEDIDSSYTYIKEKLEAPQADENLIKEIIEKINYIKKTPYTRPLVHDGFLIKTKSLQIKYGVKYYV